MEAPNLTIERALVADLVPYARNSKEHPAEQLGRVAYCMELDPHYCDVIIERWQAFTGRTAERIT